MARELRRSIAHRAAPSPAHRSNTIGSIPQTSDPAINSALYDELLVLEQQEGVIRNTDFVCCKQCDTFVDECGAISIRNCLHNVCISCVRELIDKSRTIEVKCPVAECAYNLQDREVRSLLTQIEFANHMQKAFETSDGQLYEELKIMEDHLNIIHCTEKFECGICIMDVEAIDGMMLHECLHQFCIDCVRSTINHSDDTQIQCPNSECNACLTDREIRSLLTQSEFDKYMEKTLRLAETTIPNSYHCKRPNCNGWGIVEDEINHFQCPSCTSVNCLPCQVLPTNEHAQNDQSIKSIQCIFFRQFIRAKIAKNIKKNCASIAWVVKNDPIWY